VIHSLGIKWGFQTEMQSLYIVLMLELVLYWHNNSNKPMVALSPLLPDFGSGFFFWFKGIVIEISLKLFETL